MRTHHQKVLATLANCEKDHKDKLKLDKEFEEFEKLVRREARKSREVHDLLLPLEGLKEFIVHGAYGKHLIVPPPKKKKKVSTARATHRARRK